jgi:hypothetical protein
MSTTPQRMMGVHAAMIRASLEPPTFPTFPEFLEMIASYASDGLDEHDEGQMQEFANGFETQWNSIIDSLAARYERLEPPEGAA